MKKNENYKKILMYSSLFLLCSTTLPLNVLAEKVQSNESSLKLVDIPDSTEPEATNVTTNDHLDNSASSSSNEETENKENTTENEIPPNDIDISKTYSQEAAWSAAMNKQPEIFSRSFMSSESFIDSIAPHAVKVATERGLYPSVMMAQAILESGWGKSGLASAPNYNLFGIKGSYNGQSVMFPTWEFINGQWVTVQAAFRKYPSYTQSFEDNGDLLRNGLTGDPNFYSGTWVANTSSYRDATQWLQGRYATDPTYASKLNSTIEANNLTQYDTIQKNYRISIEDLNFVSPTYAKQAQEQLTSVFPIWSTVVPSNQMKNYAYIQTGDFLNKVDAEQVNKNFMTSTGFWASVEKSDKSRPYYRVETGGFLGKQTADMVLSKFIKDTGWWAEVVPTGEQNKYKIITGDFLDPLDQDSVVRYFASEKWWSTGFVSQKTPEPYYKIVTGNYLNHPDAVKSSKDFFAANNVWAQSLDSTLQFQLYKINTGGFGTYENTLHWKTMMESKFNWNMTIEEDL